MGQEVGPEGWLQWSAHPLGVAVCRVHAQYPGFAPGTLLFVVVVVVCSPGPSEVEVGVLVSLYLIYP